MRAFTRFGSSILKRNSSVSRDRPELLLMDTVAVQESVPLLLLAILVQSGDANGWGNN